MKVLFICTGNTCRSPMAEALLKDGSTKFSVQSAGTHTDGNDPAHPNTTKVLMNKGISYDHTSQLVTNERLDWADIVLTMTMQHKQLLLMQYPDQHEKYFTLKEYALGLELPAGRSDILDPFGSSISIYEETLKEIKKYIELIIQQHD